MALPTVPTNFLVQPGNAQVYASWDHVASTGTVTYDLLRSADGVTFSTLVSTTGTNSYYDTSGQLGTQYWYKVAARTSAGQGGFSSVLSTTPVDFGQVSLGQIRLAAQQRADMVNSNYVTVQEWNSYITKSYHELYDLLIQTYGDEYYAASTAFVTDGRSPASYPLPKRLYKLLGVDLSVGAANNNGWLTLKKYTFLSRNRYVYGNTPVSFIGVMNLRYRMIGSNVEFIPVAQSGQTIQLHYIPRPATLLADSDILDGISGWDELVVIDAAIKALQKEESDVTVLVAQKMLITKRIEEAAQNRDVGLSEQATDVRRLDGMYFDDTFGGGPSGGF
jgi:hypothetical protein